MSFAPQPHSAGTIYVCLRLRHLILDATGIVIYLCRLLTQCAMAGKNGSRKNGQTHEDKVKVIHRALSSIRSPICKKRLPPNNTHIGSAGEQASTADESKPQSKLSTLQQSMRSKLDSANFRMLNETMYTSTGADAKALLDGSPQLFQAYHAGYNRQVKRWPRNPLDDVIAFLRTQRHSLRVADLGCGEARLARQAPQNHISSFDLIAANDDVTACDIAHLPMSDGCVDIVVFCLSLMGTNYGDFMSEARRILAPNGIVLVAEVASRFDGHDTQAFVTGVQGLGFRCLKDHPFLRDVSGGTRKAKRKCGGRAKKKKKNLDEVTPVKSSAFFFKFVFQSTKENAEGGGDGHKMADVEKLPRLNACLYKKR